MHLRNLSINSDAYNLFDYIEERYDDENVEVVDLDDLKKPMGFEDLAAEGGVIRRLSAGLLALNNRVPGNVAVERGDVIQTLSSPDGDVGADLREGVVIHSQGDWSDREVIVTGVIARHLSGKFGIEAGNLWLPDPDTDEKLELAIAVSSASEGSWTVFRLVTESLPEGGVFYDHIDAHVIERVGDALDRERARRALDEELKETHP